ncbi:serine hydrolase domain-containing protein [Streptomyces bambusae]
MTNSTARKARWTILTASGAALVALAAGAAVPAAAAAPGGPAVHGTVTAAARGPVDRAALRASLDGLPDEVIAGAMVRVGGRDGRWRGTAGPLSTDPQASFRIGSITKLFTSAVVLQLVAEGRLGLDTPVQEVLPGTFPAHWAPITVEQLLSHTSGLPFPRCLERNRPYPAEELVRNVAQCGVDPAPEERIVQVYNGVNHFVLGLAVEKVTGRPFAEEVERRIARPLGLRHTYVPAAGDTSMPAPSLAAPTPVDPWAWAEGGMVSTAPELERFLSALLRGRLLPPAQQRLLFEMPAHAELGFSRAGLQRIRLADGSEVWGKTGSYGQYVNGVFAHRRADRVLVYSLVPTGFVPVPKPGEPRPLFPEEPYIRKIAKAGFGAEPEAAKK